MTRKHRASLGLLSHFIIVSMLLLSMASSAAGEIVTAKSGKYQTAVIELYTSEGCSSCPPADQWLEQLIRIPQEELNILTLAFHVDYWDYIGWKDRFANPAYSIRQRHLARLNRQSSIYTPEFFVGGQETRGTRQIMEKALQINQTLSTVDLELTAQQQNNQLTINLSSKFASAPRLLVRFVLFEDNLSSDIKRGENSNKTLSHQRVVRYLSPQQKLQPHIEKTIILRPEWKTQQLGIGALVLSGQGDYMQAVYSMLKP
jgi:hypothetical protein